MGFFEEFIESTMPEEMREAYKKEKEQIEEKNAKYVMTAHALANVFDRFVREAPLDEVQMLEISILKAARNEGDAPYMIGQIHFAVKERGYCTGCFQPLTECASGH